MRAANPRGPSHLDHDCEVGCYAVGVGVHRGEAEGGGRAAAHPQGVSKAGEGKGGGSMWGEGNGGDVGGDKRELCTWGWGTPWCLIDLIKKFELVYPTLI